MFSFHILVSPNYFNFYFTNLNIQLYLHFIFTYDPITQTFQTALNATIFSVHVNNIRLLKPGGVGSVGNGGRGQTPSRCKKEF